MDSKKYSSLANLVLIRNHKHKTSLLLQKFKLENKDIV